jgi:hypothetical protein
MSTNARVPVAKDEDRQVPVPGIWRPTLAAIVEAFREGDFELARGIPEVSPISPEDADAISENIEGYGATLTALPDDSWRTSVCQWMDGYWHVLVDLYTQEEGASDLALDVRVREHGTGYLFEVHLVYVP